MVSEIDVNNPPDAYLLTVDVDKAFGVRFGKRRNINVFCPFHEDPAESQTRSCSVSHIGLFKCQACGAKGTAADFYRATHEGLSVEESIALTTLVPGVVHPIEEKKAGPKTEGSVEIHSTVPLRSSLVLQCATDLTKEINEGFLTYLRTTRGLSQEIIDAHGLGCDEYRITIPVFNDSNQPINIRRYLPPEFDLSGGTYPKMVSHKRGDSTPRLYPHNTLERADYGEELIICEGEFDALLLLTHGFNAVTNTGNVSVWCEEWTRQLMFYDIVIIFDVNDHNHAAPELNDLGQRMARERANQFLEAGCPSVKIVPLPLTNRGGDITDYFVATKHTSEDLRALIDNTPPLESMSDVPLLTTPSDEITSSPLIASAMIVKPDLKAAYVTLHDASEAKHTYKCVRMRCLVAGHAASPYIIPKHILVRIRDDKGTVTTVNKQFTAWDGVILGLLQCSTTVQNRIIRVLLNVPKTSSMNVEILESMTVEEVYLIPTIDYEKDQGPYVIRRCFYTGHGLQTNQVYDFLGYTLPFPQTQAATHVLVKATPAETNIDNFELTPALYEELKRVFQAEDVHGKFQDIAAQLAGHITHIYGRADLHTSIDLVFHSPLIFDFGGTRVRKGWLEALILGDTRTGKGFVTEGLSRHYGVGEVISGENLTLAGLVGGVQHIGDRWTLVWGKIPLNDKRLIVLDECGSLSQNEIGRLSRIRSEGVAEITKVVTEKTSARTRLIWLGNPRPTTGGSPRMMKDYNYGIEAVVDLIGAAEDLARFDFVLTVAQNEVSSREINQDHPARGKLKYTSELCRNLVLWAWSRKPEQVIFDKAVTALALKAAKSLGQTFSSRICLIQPEDVRYKLARIAAAAAARTFSTPDGVQLIVKEEHMQFAYNFLHYIYSKPSSGYAQMSAQDDRNANLRDEEAIQATLESAANPLDLIEGLLAHKNLTVRDMCDYAGVDIYQARGLISDLVRSRAIVKEHSYYVKKPAFKTFLQKLRTSLSEEHPVTDDSDSEEKNTSDEKGGKE